VFQVVEVHAVLSNLLIAPAADANKSLLTSRLTSQSSNSTQRPGVAGVSGIVWLLSGPSRSWSARAARASGRGRHCSGIPWTCRNLMLQTSAHLTDTFTDICVQFSLFAQLNSTNASVRYNHEHPIWQSCKFQGEPG
jgi:hypothetical protein